MKAIIFALTITFLSGCSVTQLTGGTNESAITVSGVNDPLESTIKVSTHGYSTPFLGTVSTNTGDPFFRGFVDKKTNEKNYQLYTTIRFTDWAYWNTVKFLKDEKPVSIPSESVDNDVDCSQYGCSHYEEVVTVIDEATLDSWASSKEPVVVRYYSPRVSSSIDVELNQDEIKAFMNKMNSL